MSVHLPGFQVYGSAIWKHEVVWDKLINKEILVTY